MQDAFLRAFEKLAGFHEDSSFYTWIYRIAINLALSDRRRRGRSWPDPAAHRAYRWTPPTTRAAAIRSPRSNRPSNAHVQEALNALAPDHRAVIVFEGPGGSAL